ncbi:MAG TPA: glycosyltransferase, partial [Stellaceae bacterium]|nr:glycosyltransferase [Stellaceae bacterium]
MGPIFQAGEVLSPEELGVTLVVAPHPDDETIACGGLIALLRRGGHQVWVAIVTDGTASHPNSKQFPPTRLAAIRKTETVSALALLGVEEEHIVFKEFPDGFVPSEGTPGFDCAVENAVRCLERLAPQTLVIPSSLDTHEDHKATAAIWLRAGQISPVTPRILEYVIWPNGLIDNQKRQAIIDISDVFELKRQAIAIYRSQLGLLVTDDPTGFILPGHVLNRATKPAEIFLESKAIQWPWPPSQLAKTVIEREYGALTVTFFGEEPKPAQALPTWPTVSVIIPTHNRAQWVVRAVKSALSQTVAQHLEIIVIDDGSTDGTEAALSPYRDKIQYRRQKNQGVVAARNNGIYLARGEFIALLDSDDSWLPWKIEAQLACFAIKPDLALVWTNAALVDDQQNCIWPDYVRSYVAYRFFHDE